MEASLLGERTGLRSFNWMPTADKEGCRASSMIAELLIDLRTQVFEKTKVLRPEVQQAVQYQAFSCISQNMMAFIATKGNIFNATAIQA